jgi:hypothetical protein
MRCEPRGRSAGWFRGEESGSGRHTLTCLSSCTLTSPSQLDKVPTECCALAGFLDAYPRLPILAGQQTPGPLWVNGPDPSPCSIRRGVDIFTSSGIFTLAVKKPTTVKMEGRLPPEARRILAETPGIDLTPREQPGDVILRFAGRRAPVVIEVKQTANSAAAWQLVEYTKANPKAHLLLVARETTAEAREILRDHGIAVVDGLGNAHIELPGLLFHREGRKRGGSKARTNRTSLRGRGGLVAQAMLLEPNTVWHLTELAQIAGVSTPLVYRVIKRLEDDGLVGAEGSGPNRVRYVINPTALLDLWAEEVEEERIVRTPAYLLAQTERQIVNQAGDRLTRGHVPYAVTGAAAASIIAPFVTSVPVVEIWVTATATAAEVLDAGRADPATNGHNIVFLQAKRDAPLAFTEEREGLVLADRFRVYADLRRDPRRGREQADHLRREVIGF